VPVKQEPLDHLSDVQRYFDENSARFIRRGQGGASIHRAVWGPGVKTREAAFHYVEELIRAELCGRSEIPRVLDLGCGVGSSLLYLASSMNLMAEGITISAVQAAHAQKLVEASALTDRVRCREGNYLDLFPDLVDFDLAFAIEAFVHTPDAPRFFEESARAIRPGGKLILCDDFLALQDRTRAPKRERRWIANFERGWHIGSLITVEQASELAAAAGFRFVKSSDLTPHLELRRVRDRLVAWALQVERLVPLRSKYWMALSGGDALQRALVARAIRYCFVVFERL